MPAIRRARLILGRSHFEAAGRLRHRGWELRLQEIRSLDSGEMINLSSYYGLSI